MEVLLSFPLMDDFFIAISVMEVKEKAVRFSTEMSNRRLLPVKCRWKAAVVLFLNFISVCYGRFSLNLMAKISPPISTATDTSSSSASLPSCCPV